MKDASFVNSSHEQPSCFLDIALADCLFVRHSEESLMFVYYWYANDETEYKNDSYCLMIFNFN